MTVVKGRSASAATSVSRLDGAVGSAWQRHAVFGRADQEATGEAAIAQEQAHLRGRPVADILPLIISMVARLAFSVQQWSPPGQRHPLALFCDEAHLYIPQDATSGGAENAIHTFERIAKEGRKYGVGLVVISQRPAEVSRTVVSQCSNLIAMRVTNGDDQAVVRRLLPDSLGGFGDLLPVPDTGEALVVGDAIPLPTRIRIAQPKNEPLGGTIDFWDRWADTSAPHPLNTAVDAWRRQSTSK